MLMVNSDFCVRCRHVYGKRSVQKVWVYISTRIIIRIILVIFKLKMLQYGAKVFDSLVLVNDELH